MRTVTILLALAACSRPTEAKPTPAQAETWVHVFGDEHDQDVRALALDHAGNVVVVGAATGSLDLGDGVRTAAAPSLFVAKYDENGRLTWARLYGKRAFAETVSILANNDILVGGTVAPPVDLGSGVLPFDAGGDAMFLLELAPDGKTVAAHLYGDPTHAMGHAITNAVAVAPDGDWIAAGRAFPPIDLGAGLVPNKGISPSFVARYAPDGKPRWVRIPNIAPSSFASANRLAISPSGDVYVCGSFDGVPGVPTGDDAQDAFVQRLGAVDGSVVWTKTFHGGMGDCTGLVVIGDELVASGVLERSGLVALGFDGTIRWRSPHPGRFDALAVDGESIFAAGTAQKMVVFARFAADGTARGEKRMPGDVLWNGLAVRGSALFVGGALDGETDLGTGHVIPTQGPENVSSLPDGIVARIAVSL